MCVEFMETKTFPCTEEGAIAAQAFLEAVSAAPKAMVVLDEIVSNIVRCSGASGFSVGFDQTPEGLTMIFSDDGKPFDPTRDVKEPDVTASAEERGIGGLGIFMVKKMSKSVTYRRDAGLNVLTVML